MDEIKIYNSAGQEIVLNDQEKRVAQFNQTFCNALGVEVNITTLTTLIKRVVEQKFFEISIADYLPIRVGEGAWSTSLTTFRSFNVGDSFSKGIIEQGSNNSRLATADAAVDSVSIDVNNWAKETGWSLFELQQAQKAGNWGLVEAKEKARKKNWDLGIQEISFLGLGSASPVKGLLNQPGVVVNTGLITKFIKSMTATELNAFAAGILGAYRANCKYTAWPTHFVIPEEDYLGLAVPSSADFPLKSKLQVLQETLQIMTKNAGFQVLPLSYASASISGETTHTYALYKSDEDSLRMDIPVDYTATVANSINNFSFQNVGYGQFTGVMAYRPSEMLYFRFNA